MHMNVLLCSFLVYGPLLLESEVSVNCSLVLKKNLAHVSAVPKIQEQEL